MGTTLHRTTRARAIAWLSLSVLVLACSSTAPREPSAVIFDLESTTCGLTMPMHFSIDSATVGTDTFVINGQAPGYHHVSRPFVTTASRHVLGAHGTWISFEYVWPDTVLTLAPGETFTKVLSLYCS
jgi:hypothetical protein